MCVCVCVGLVAPEKKCKEKSTKRSKRKSSEFQSNEASQVKQIKTEEEVAVSQLVS